MSDPNADGSSNPRLAANRRMATEGQAIPALPDRTASAPVGRFGKKWTPEERAKQNAELARILMERR